ncbi:MAG: acyl-CoA dehydratase activase [Bacteroidales bacterium]|nr:acyl-CoA dehydratase activase [Bacteroidales bacterium]
MIKPEGNILSIDIGSLAVSAVEVSTDAKVLGTFYKYHHGQAADIISELPAVFNFKGIRSVVSPSAAYVLSERVLRYDPQASLIKCFRSLYKDHRALLMVGAGRFQLLHFNDDGSFAWAASNTSCAAGTGSFLDQQARRLDIRSAYELSNLADKNRGSIPDIASRCSVFAKTDLIHAQQAGYSLESICDSLCRGLARNLADTLFNGSDIKEEMVFVGGVSKNRAVRRHLESITGVRMVVNDLSVFFPAIGAALLHLSDNKGLSDGLGPEPGDILAKSDKNLEYVYEPLEIKLSSYPDEMRDNDMLYTPQQIKHPSKVQVDIYMHFLKPGTLESYIGIDIGSTSTKGMLTDTSGRPVAGFYTYTNGQPLNATRAILESIVYLFEKRKITLSVQGVATTGSGRKFIGAIIGADMIIDEITTHARAAHELNPDTDTIIEIGGQDAKFTVLKNGRVVFSKMNSVCAAGTGSFIEEQALRMDVSLRDYSSLAQDARAPLASDRCTVFMERDINYYTNKGYGKNEILAAVLHSVRDNYLKKVAVESSIGDNICFQGATAKNKALVAAFEMKLGKNIFVSPYCHLTGALGCALMLADKHSEESNFRGFGIIEEEIRVRNEVCKLCNNNCTIIVADVHWETVAYGFLCGRDYKSDKYVDRNISGFDLLRERKKILKVTPLKGKSEEIKIGFPSALNMFEDMSFWKFFFRELGFTIVGSDSIKDPVTYGKQLAGAEFCAPIHAMHAHVKWLEDKADYIFMPAVLENRSAGEPAKELYCYYTQFSPSVTSLLSSRIKEKAIVPLLRFEKGLPFVLKTLTDSLNGTGGRKINMGQVRSAWETATREDKKQKAGLLDLYKYNFHNDSDLSVVLMGRPYMILAGQMNNNIPDIFGGLGIKTFYQDMLPLDDYATLDGIDKLLKSMPWHFASQLLKAASFIAGTKGLYPVLITAFKCAPDSFVIDYFQMILDAVSKPYLILQVDEHDSSVGYETRVEAAVRSFRNHYQAENGINTGKNFSIVRPEYKLKKDRTVLFPNWDQIACRFLAANLRRHGYDTQLMDHSRLGIQKAMASNSGQCLPLNIIAHDYIDYMEKNGLDPTRTILWMTETVLSCNIRMYPQYIKSILENHGNGYEKASVYSGEVGHTEISVDVTRYAYFAYMLSGLLRRTACKIRPYEINEGETDVLLDESVKILEGAFDGRESLDNALTRIMPGFAGIRKEKEEKPLVAIFGDFFVRDNDIMNQDLIHTIESYGGEALSTPYSEFYKLIAGNVMRRRSVDTGRLQIAAYRAILQVMKILERKYYRHFEPFLGEAKVSSSKELEKNLVKYNIDKYHSGESFDNILKIYHIIESYPGISLFVQTNPAFCCPSLITEAMKNEIRKNTGIPIVTITYDGTTESKNDVIAPYLSG